MAFNRGYESTNANSRHLLLEATEKLLEEEGQYAISARRIAERARVKPPLVHYFFRTMDDLLVAVFQASAQRDAKLQSAALASTRPLHALWELNRSIPRCRINIAFIALCAVHEKLRQEMQKVEERARSKQLTALEQLFSTREIDQKLYTPISITMLIATAARTVAMETTVGISLGHSELAQLVERILDELEPHQLASGDASKPRQTNFGEASSTSGRLSYAPD